ncbi:hypothetical protein Tco_1231093, partial [Tanacetum coccineum]
IDCPVTSMFFLEIPSQYGQSILQEHPTSGYERNWTSWYTPGAGYGLCL